MAFFHGFHALMPRPEQAAAVAAPPYDVVGTAEAAALAADNPLSFLRVSRPEIELEAGSDPYSDAAYAKARENFLRLCRTAPLETDQEANLYVYRLRLGRHSQTGVAGLASAAEYDAGVIKKHETTRRDKEDDRTRHLMALRSHTGPALLTYRAEAEIDKLIAETTGEKPYFSFASSDGVEHELWKAGAARSAELAALFESGAPCFYIADGHHRAAAAARVAAACRAANPRHTGNEDYNFFLAVAFPARDLNILAYHRVVRDLNGMTATQFLARLAAKFTVEPAAVPEPPRSGCFGMYLEGAWRLLTPKFSLTGLDEVGRLDVSILQDNVLCPLLGIADPRTSGRIDFIGGIRSVKTLEKRVDSGAAAAAFSLFPVTVEQLTAIADAGRIMPPKSTWFEPKLRDGLVSHNF